MACSTISHPESGFMTPAATLVSLALGLGAAAAVSASVSELKLARSDFRRTQIETRLDDAEQRTALTILNSGPSGPLSWSLNVDQRAVQVLAEPEAPKASITSLLLMDDSAFARLGVSDPRAFKARLKILTIGEALGEPLESADPSPLWRVCARTLASPFGLGDRLQITPAASPSAAETVGHAGELWRIRVRDELGWTDDRVIRFTGDALRPAAPLARRFLKTTPSSKPCDELLASAN
jgi:hypothetical protein